MRRMASVFLNNLTLESKICYVQYMVYYTNVERGMSDLEVLKPMALSLAKSFGPALTSPIQYSVQNPPSNAAYNQAKDIVNKAQRDIAARNKEEITLSYDIAKKSLERVLFLRVFEDELFGKASKEGVIETSFSFCEMAVHFFNNAQRLYTHIQKQGNEDDQKFLAQARKKHTQAERLSRRVTTDLESYKRYNRFISDEDRLFYDKVWQEPTDPSLAYGEHLCSLAGLFTEVAMVAAAKVESYMDTARMVDSVLFAHNEAERITWQNIKTTMMGKMRPHAKNIPLILNMAEDHYKTALRFCVS